MEERYRINATPHEKLQRLWGTLNDLIMGRTPLNALQSEAVVAYAVLRRCTHVHHDSYIAPMAVGFDRTGYLLHIDMSFIERIKKCRDFWTVIIHEALHIMKRDLPRFVRLYKSFVKKDLCVYVPIAMIAADLDVNSLVGGLDETLLVSPTLIEAVGGAPVRPPLYRVESYLSLEKYFAYLSSQLTEEDKEQLRRRYAGGKGGVCVLSESIFSGDNTSVHPWDECYDTLDEGDKDIIAEALDTRRDQIVFDACAEVAAAGSLPNHYASELAKLTNVSQTHWGAVLKKYVVGSLYAAPIHDYSRPKRNRFLYSAQCIDTKALLQLEPLFPGKKRVKTFALMVAIDTSGSMDRASVQEALTELQGIHKELDVSISVIQCDTSVSNIYVLEKSTTVAHYMNTVGRTSSGGTSFTPIMKLARYTHTKRVAHLPALSVGDRSTASQLRAVDAIVYITDGGAPMPSLSEKPPCKVIWLITKRGADAEYVRDAANFGGVIKIK